MENVCDSPNNANNQMQKQNSSDLPENNSEISSNAEIKVQLGDDDGYEGDSSDNDECQWLLDLDHRRARLPNFWLILHLSDDHVNVYFHCRFLELRSPEVHRYQQVYQAAVSQIKSICRIVNQYLLLRDLHDKRVCDPMLEPESIEDYTWKNSESSDDISRFQSGNSHNNIKRKGEKIIFAITFSHDIS